MKSRTTKFFKNITQVTYLSSLNDGNFYLGDHYQRNIILKACCESILAVKKTSQLEASY